MNFKERCILLLDEEHMFENSGHRTRFKELLDCYGDYPFFSRGLNKKRKSTKRENILHM